MDLYDDIDAKPRASQVDGWSSGIKMLQTQLAVKKAQLPKPHIRDQIKKPLMTPVVNLRAKRPADHENFAPMSLAVKPITTSTTLAPAPVLESIKTDGWDFVDEYDPQWPNEYEKLREKDKPKGHDKSRQREERDRDRDREPQNRDRDRKRNRSGRRDTHTHDNSPPPVKFSGFSQRPSEEDKYSPPPMGSISKQSGGAAIAPPPSLSIDSGNNSSSNVTIPYSASSVAAKIMAKYGFKDGQGLGKSEQGMSMALQVEKTSKRGGRIIHENDVFLPPAAPSSPPPPTPPPQLPTVSSTPTNSSPQASSTAVIMPPPPPVPAAPAAPAAATEPSITEIMKTPSKVVLLRNMVGPGDVDEDLEPEVKDECNTKYGDVNSVIIHEAFGTVPEDAVKIFVEFKRIESAIKAVVDLNGRFFGGRQVRAGFYNFDKFKSFQLN
ncbi:splicing factor 45 [Drosophila busckii]|uniref:splicing factor 45 n=1 Tax=Drosophila busckii TaxID=30019 RepID=UPI0014329C10|nr:splicing factor 45 [Drosophila busckii]